MAQARHNSAVSGAMLSLKSFVEPMLKKLGFADDRKIKLYKHVNHPHPEAWDNFPARKGVLDVEQVYQAGLMKEFQAANSGNKTYGDDIVFFFLGEEGGLCRFVGAYEIKKKYDNGDICQTELAKRAIAKRFYTPSKECWYELAEIEGLDFLVDRMIARWTGRGSERNLNDKIALFELRSEGAFKTFPGFDQLLLNYNDLKKHFRYQATSPWVKVLRNTRGVYLIADKSSGQLYVGSATGKDGLWGRWSHYAQSNHGGNKLLLHGIKTGALDPINFQISVLDTLSRSASRDDGLKAEQNWKLKLGKKAVTLSGN